MNFIEELSIRFKFSGFLIKSNLYPKKIIHYKDFKKFGKFLD